MNLVWAAVFFLVLWSAWLTNILGLPGNWIMLVCAIGYWAWMPPDTSLSISVGLLVALAVIATLGEVLELVAGSAGVSKAGGSRRSAFYAIMGSICGALVGLVVGVPIPIFGPIIGSLLLGSVGAMAGAMYGERIGGRGWRETARVGKAAFWGRALGTLGKMAAGLLMICVALAGLLL